jgi:hypothetical protein
MKFYYFLALIFLYMVSNVNSISTGANEPIADNELGLTAKDCALQYCSVKDGMALWLTLVNECVKNPNPYFINIDHLEKESEIIFNKNEDKDINAFLFEKNDLLTTGITCSVMSLVGLLFGYVLGIKTEDENQYIQLNQRKKKYQNDVSLFK